MARITKVYRESFPAVRFTGKCYSNKDRGSDGGYGEKWGEWFREGWFARLEAAGETSIADPSYVGLMGASEDADSFEYWVGMFLKENAAVPEGFSYVDIPAGEVGICFVYGKEQNDNLYGMHDECMKAFRENGMGAVRGDFRAEGTWRWFFERYNCPRFTTPDENGNVILDYGVYIV